MRGLIAGVAVFGACALVLGAVVHHAFGSKARDPSLEADAAGLPAPQRPAFTVGRPRLLDRHETRSRFAAVVRSVDARRTPSSNAPALTELGPKTPEGTTNIALVIGERRRPDGLWLRVRLPVLPNNVTGWVPRSALGGYEFVHTHLAIDRTRFTATLYRDGREVFTARVGVGKPGSPTPSGEFYVRDRLHGFGNPFYGPVAFGTSARSAVLTDWPAGGFVGLHGTNEPGLIPGRISHGCVRFRNSDVLRLSRLMPVGTSVTIR